MDWISKRIESANWRGFMIWFAILMIFSTWAFAMDSPWTRALEFAGGKVPEMQPGIPAIEPVRSLQAMGANTGDYLLWQALDLPYAFMNLMVTWMGMGLGLKALRMKTSFLRFLMILPPIYLICEIVENALLAAFASGVIAPSESFVLVQQLATTLKFSSFMPSFALSILGALIALLLLIIRTLRKPS